MATCRLQNAHDASYISYMATAVVVSIIASLAVAVVWLRSKTQKLSPALRAEYEELAEWAERETAHIRDAYARTGSHTESAEDMASGTDGRRSSGAGTSMKATTTLRIAP